MTMRSTWNAAKKVSDTNFKAAYSNWLAAERKKAGEGSEKSAKAVNTEIEAMMGMAVGPEYTKAMSFKGGLGPLLDKLEKAHGAAEKARSELKLATLLKNKKVNALWKHFAEKTNFTAESYHYLTTGHKLSANKIYPLYIVKGSEYMLNIDSGLTKEWEAAAQNNAWKKAPVKATTAVVSKLVTSDRQVEKFKDHATYAKFLRADLGGKTVPGLCDKAIKVAMAYARQTQAYGKRWKKQEPDFWTPLNVALNEIVGKLNEIKALYP